MTLDQIKTVAVLGAGTMGNGIAHVFARAGYSVILRDLEQRYLERGLETVAKKANCRKPSAPRYSAESLWSRTCPPSMEPIL
jgi:3-hydroxybutyryl-CoA dehydrogenase